MNRWQASIPTDKISLFSPASLTNLSLKLQFCMKKAAMKLSSLPLKMSVSYRNRTYNRVLGGPRYIHLTKETNAVFSGFSALLAPAAISMNSITLVMNFHCILFWHSGQSLLESNSDLSLLNFHKSQPWLNLRSSSPRWKPILFWVKISQWNHWFFYRSCEFIFMATILI